MKKVILMLATIMMLAVCSVCSATPGKVLDSELFIIDKFLTAPNYKAIEPMLEPDFKKDFNENTFNNFKKVSDANFGALNSKTLRLITKLDDADILEFQASFAKAPQAAVVFAFAVEKEKPLVRFFNIQLPPKAEPQAAPAQPEKK